MPNILPELKDIYNKVNVPVFMAHVKNDTQANTKLSIQVMKELSREENVSLIIYEPSVTHTNIMKTPTHTFIGTPLFINKNAHELFKSASDFIEKL